MAKGGRGLRWERLPPPRAVPPAPKPLKLTALVPSEAQVQRALIQRLLFLSCVRGVLRINSGALRELDDDTDDERYVPFARLYTKANPGVIRARLMKLPREFQSGFPDLLVLLVNHRCAWIEVKKLGEVPRPNQQEVLNFLLLSDQAVHVCDGDYAAAQAFVEDAARGGI